MATVGSVTGHLASWWEPAADNRVRCRLCPHQCLIAEGRVGVCRVRKNVGGKLHALTYGRVSSLHLDPIEKKPLFHFHPGSPILSLGAVGCNLSCRFCQNWEISQEEVPTRALPPEEAVRLARAEPGNLGLAYTYNEPLIWFEYIRDTANLARAAGLQNVLVTNGYIEEDPLGEILPRIDALNVDVKSMRDEFYVRLCGAKTAAPVRRTVEMARDRGVHVEVTNLVIPGWNDADDDFEQLTDWLAGVDSDIPLHFSRYHPSYQMEEPPTPAATLARAREIASRSLHYVYLGNLPGAGGEDTACPACGEIVVRRRGFSVGSIRVKGGRCEHCGAPVPILGT
jgi:pyruvate formate lyase activating enzyme